MSKKCRSLLLEWRRVAGVDAGAGGSVSAVLRSVLGPPCWRNESTPQRTVLSGLLFWDQAKAFCSECSRTWHHTQHCQGYRGSFVRHNSYHSLNSYSPAHTRTTCRKCKRNCRPNTRGKWQQISTQKDRTPQQAADQHTIYCTPSGGNFLYDWYEAKYTHKLAKNLTQHSLEVKLGSIVCWQEQCTGQRD